MDTSSPESCGYFRCLATKPTEARETNKGDLESKINDCIHSIVEGIKGNVSNKADPSAAQGNAVTTSKEFI